MQSNKFLNEVDVQSRLAAIGLSRGVLVEVAKQYALTILDMDDNHPSWGRAITPMSEAHHALRELAREEGWIAREIRGFSLIVNEHSNIAINIAKGCENTGNANVEPMTSAVKGILTHKAINTNQMVLDFGGEQESSALTMGGMRTYYMLVRFLKGRVFCELSLPAALNEDNRIAGWFERIIFPPITLETESEFVDETDEPVIDVKIRRKT